MSKGCRFLARLNGSRTELSNNMADINDFLSLWSTFYGRRNKKSYFIDLLLVNWNKTRNSEWKHDKAIWIRKPYLGTFLKCLFHWYAIAILRLLLPKKQKIWVCFDFSYKLILLSSLTWYWWLEEANFANSRYMIESCWTIY